MWWSWCYKLITPMFADHSSCMSDEVNPLVQQCFVCYVLMFHKNMRQFGDIKKRVRNKLHAFDSGFFIIIHQLFLRSATWNYLHTPIHIICSSTAQQREMRRQSRYWCPRLHSPSHHSTHRWHTPSCHLHGSRQQPQAPVDVENTIQ